MRGRTAALLVFLGCFPVLGCGSSAPEEPAGPVLSQLGDKIDLSLADLLTKPRADLAEQAAELEKKIQVQEKSRREGRLKLGLVPDLRLPVVVPVLREARYSASVGVSLPPYAREGAVDAALALHLARFGDAEAARKLADPGDAATVQEIDRLRLGRNYPVEWTRLVALHLHAAQNRLATGDVDGGTELVALHKQLKELLDPKAAASPLGQDLLSRGRDVLGRAAEAWKTEKRPDLTARAEEYLAAWGDRTPPQTAVGLGQARGDVARALGALPSGRAVLAPAPLRVLDLCNLPFPDEGLEAAVASFDTSDHLDRLLLTYRTRIADHFPEPRQFAYLAEERVAGTDGGKSPGLRRRSYRLGEVPCEVTLVTRGAGVGALVLLGSGLSANAMSALPRDLGAFHLDRSFEQNRLRLAPERRGETVAVEQPKVLETLKVPFGQLRADAGELRRVPGHDVAAGLALSCPTDASGLPSLHQLAVHLWANYGFGAVEAKEDDVGGHLELRWRDAQTDYVLRLPYESAQPLRFDVSDRQGADRLAERAARALALDRDERSARLSAGKPVQRLPRRLEHLELGMPRDQVVRLLPVGRGIARRDIPGGVTVAVNAEPEGKAAYVARQLFVRFDAQGRAGELRVRYAATAAGAESGRWAADLQRTVAGSAGAALELPSAWSRLWPELPARKPQPTLSRWQDDVTALTVERDAGGIEVVLRDCPAEHANGLPLPPLEYLPPGPAECPLGAERAQLFQRWHVTEPTTTDDGAVVLRPAAPGPYDALLLWFENDRVARVVARHAPPAGKTVLAADATRLVSEAWARDFAILGWPRRHDAAGSGTVRGLGWHDEHTRTRIFWQEGEGGSCQVFTEWRRLP